MHRSAIISPCGRYRYRLTRGWDVTRYCLGIVMLNPSIAGAEIDDPTIRRCIDFANGEGYGGIDVCNLFALRASDPADLRNSDISPIGPDNCRHLLDLSSYARQTGAPILCAWGSAILPADCRSVPALVKDILRPAELVCLGRTMTNQPRHPLYVRAIQSFEPFV